ncbi:MAG: head-tail adaptor protein [Marivivens sp.]|nr:head-tail adaptor protein [Marivivens sp.]
MSGPQLTRKLVLEAPVESADGSGGRRRDWVALGALWAEVDGRSGREARGAAGALSRARYRIIVRAEPEGHSGRPVAGQRLREGTRVFDVLAVTELDAEARYLICHAEEERAT